MADKMKVKFSSAIKSINVVGSDMGHSLEDDSQQKEIESLQVKLEAMHVDFEKLQKEKAELESVCDILKNASDELYRAQETVFCDVREQIVNLSVSIAEKILHKQVEQGEYDIKGIVLKALEVLPGSEKAEIHLNRSDMSKVNEHLGDNHAKFGEVVLKENNSVKPGECSVKTNKGIIDYIVSEHLRLVEESLKGKH